MSSSAIEIHSLAKRFGKNRVLENVTLRVPAGKTYAFLGRNGAGKTTTIRTLLGLLEPDAGQISVLGLNPKSQTIEIRSRVGYMAENQKMFGWMRVSELIGFVGAFYPNWDSELALKLTKDFDLPQRTRVKNLSQGQNTRLALLLALAYRPELVILDDPTLGLDPIMRKEFLRDVVEHLQGAGATVFFSSHLLYEIEPVADIVGILENGRIIVQSETEQLRDKVKQFVVSNDGYEKLAPLQGELDATVHGSQVAVVVEDVEATRRVMASEGIHPQVEDLNLDEIFKAYVTGNKGARP